MSAWVCQMCGREHVGPGPKLCENLRLLVEGIQEYLTAEDEQEASDGLLAVCDAVLGVEELEDEDDEEVYQ
jgi:hypothetical protein